MSVRRRLKRALRAIDDAKAALNRVRNQVEDEDDVRRALGDLEDAEAHIRMAYREIPDE